MKFQIEYLYVIYAIQNLKLIKKLYYAKLELL